MSSTSPAPNTEGAAPYFPDLLGTEMVQLFVGPEKTRLLVHKTLLCQKIPYFAKMFQGGFMEAKDNSASFPEDNRESFGLLIEWVYTGTVRPLCYRPAMDRVLAYSVVDFYALAEKMCLSEVMNNIVDSLIAHQLKETELIGLQVLKRAYEKLESNSPLLRYFADSMAYAFIANKHENNPWPTKEVSRLIGINADVRDDFLTRLRTIPLSGTKPKLPDPRRAAKCEYHHHSNDETCRVEKAV